MRHAARFAVLPSLFRPVKRSAAVPLTLATRLPLVAAGALAAACGGEPAPEALNCVESATGRVMPDSVCRAAGAAKPVAGAPGAGTAGAPAAREGSGFGVSPIGLFGWYYGGRVISGLARGGAYAPVAGRSYRSPAGSFLGTSATRSGAPVRPSLGGPAGARAGTGRPYGGAPSTSHPAARGGFGGIGAGRAGGG